MKERGDIPEFRAIGDFKSSLKIEKKIIKVKENSDMEKDLPSRFKQMLSEISRLYSRFPYYIIKLMAEDYKIPNDELKILFDAYLKKR